MTCESNDRLVCFVCGSAGLFANPLHRLGWLNSDGGHGLRTVCDDCVESTCTRCWATGVELVGAHSVCEQCVLEVGYGGDDGDEDDEHLYGR